MTDDIGWKPVLEFCDHMLRAMAGAGLGWLLWEMNGPDWELRRLMPSGNLTDILWENWDYSGQLPVVGDSLKGRLRQRVRDYDSLGEVEPAGGVTHGRDGEWAVARIEQFSSFDSDRRIVVCYCSYQPISTDWQPLKRETPVADNRVSVEV